MIKGSEELRKLGPLCLGSLSLRLWKQIQNMDKVLEPFDLCFRRTATTTTTTAPSNVLVVRKMGTRSRRSHYGIHVIHEKDNDETNISLESWLVLFVTRPALSSYSKYIY